MITVCCTMDISHHCCVKYHIIMIQTCSNLVYVAVNKDALDERITVLYQCTLQVCLAYKHHLTITFQNEFINCVF